MQQLCKVVDHHDVPAAGAPGPQRTYRDRGMHHPSGQMELQAFRRRSHPQRAPDEMLHVTRRPVAKQSRQRDGIRSGIAENFFRRSVHAHDHALRVKRKHSRRHIFENGLNQRSAPLKFLHRLLQISREVVDLLPAVGQLRRHGVERPNQRTQLIVCLHLHLRIEVSRRDLTRGLRQRLNGNGDLLREKKRKPRSREKKQHGEQR